MVCYFAHPVTDYDTEREAKDYTTLKAMGFNVVNPKGNEDNYKIHGIKFFTDRVKRCDVLAFRSFPGGSIGAGVAREIQVARDNGIIVIELPDSLEYRAKNALSVQETRRLVKSLRGQG